MKHIYDYTHYKTYLKNWIDEHTEKGLVSSLAKAAGCDRTYLSQVLNSKVQLTADHALGMAEHLGLDEEEQDYFLMMVLLDRASSQQAKAILKKKMEKIVKENTLLSKKISDEATTEELTDSQKSLYYSDALYGFVHTLVSIKESQSLEALVERTRKEKAVVLKCLEDLLEMGLVVKKGSSYQHSWANLHVPRGSSFNKVNHLNWRLRAVEKSNHEAGLHYTTLFSISKKDWMTLKQQLLQYIEKQRKQVHASGAEEVYCFCCDLFAP